MSVEWKIAWRYLIGKKSSNAINIVSGVSATAVAVVTAAMVCVLSVMNGFESLVADMFSEFDPELRITAAEGKYFSTLDPVLDSLRTMDCIAVYSEQIEETALIEYGEHRMPATLLGVDSAFQALTHIDSILYRGQFCLFDGTFERAVLGRGLAAVLGSDSRGVSGIRIFAPKRTERVNMLRPDESFHSAAVFASGTFAVNQIRYDDHYMLVSIDLARELFDYASTDVTAIGLKLHTSSREFARQKRRIEALLGEDYVVADRYEQQADFFRIVHIEKLLTLLLLVFILLIAGFNVISSLSMLILDKRDSIHTLAALGASEQQIRTIFLCEGWFISALGAGIGLAIGLLVCLVQQHFGLLKLGNGVDYVIAAYPVVVRATDIALVAAIVLLLGFLAAFIPTRKLTANE